MSIHFREQGSALIILGNTYPYRDQLKALGARFNGGEKTWRLPVTPDNIRQISELCTASGGGSLGSPSLSTQPMPSTPSAATMIMTAPLPRYQGPVPYVDEGETSLVKGRHVGPPATSELDAHSLTIRQLMERLERAMSLAFPQALWVTGEVQNLSRRSSGLFFDLAEGRSDGHANATITVRAILWQGVLKSVSALRGADLIAEVLQDGMTIRCLCIVQLYKDRGSVSLLVNDIDPSYTKGALALARERLLKELRAKGLDQANRRLAMPSFPLRLGLISADGSRAKSDFLDQLASLGYPGEVLFCSAVMQGEQVPQQVTKAVKRLEAAGCDLIVITRGGGSAADLRWFDAAEIAYAIAGAGVPIVAAIGHHDDVCVAEEVCYLRQKTPTAAADYVVSLILATRDRIDALANELAKALQTQIESCNRRLTTASERLSAAAQLSLDARTALLAQRVHSLQRSSAERLDARGKALMQRSHALQRAASERLSRLTAQMTDAQTRLERSAERQLSAKATELLALEAHLRRLDPSAWLRQGWTQLQGAGGRILSVQDTAVGATLKARLLDGWLALDVSYKVSDQESRIVSSKGTP